MYEFVSSAFVVITCFTAGVYISSTKVYSNFYIKLSNVRSFEELGKVFQISDTSDQGNDVLQKPSNIIKEVIKFPQNVKDKLPENVQKVIPDAEDFKLNLRLPIIGDIQKLIDSPGLRDIRDVFKSPECVTSWRFCFKSVKEYIFEGMLGKTWNRLTNKDTYKLPNVLNWVQNNTVTNAVSGTFTNAVDKVQSLIPKPQLNVSSIVSSPLTVVNKFQNLFSKPQSNTNSNTLQPDTSATTTKSSILGKLQNVFSKGEAEPSTTTTAKPMSDLFNSKFNLFKKNK